MHPPVQIKLKQGNSSLHNYIAFHAGHDVIWLVLVALASRPGPIRHLS
jgi:hypothetical protein